MTRQVTSKQTSRKTATPAPATHKLRTLARKAQATGRAVGRTSARVADPVIQSIRKEEPGTLAKIALAVLAPRLANYALRFALRNPIMTVAGVVLMAAIASHGAEPDAA